jgi:enterochelin esterase-like enzyme
MMSPAASGRVGQFYGDLLKHPETLNNQFKLLWLGVGKDDTLTGPGDKEFDAALTAAGVKHVFVLSDGRHEWTVWRHYLHDIAPKLFR